MKHSFLDKYSDLNSPIHRINPKIKFICFIGYILLVVFLPFRYFLILIPFLFLLMIISCVPLGYFFKRSLIILPFALLGRWELLVKGYVSVLAVVLLSSTTGFKNLVIALQSLGCPKVILMIMAFIYRYTYVIIDELMLMKQAKDSRTLKNNNWVEVRSLAKIAGVLFIRSYERAERVYMAMCSRGFTGEIK